MRIFPGGCWSSVSPRPFSASSDHTNNTSVSGSKWIPKPTWSLKDLNLTNPDDSKYNISQEELHRLERRALLISSSSQQNKDNNEKGKATTADDLSNMMHMIQQVVDSDIELEMEDPDGNLLYDSVRGVEKAPLRSNSVDDPLQEVDSKQAKQVFDSLLRPKTKPLGGQVHFRTHTDDNDKDEK